MAKENARTTQVVLSGASQVLAAKNLSRQKLIISTPAAAIALALTAFPATPTSSEVAPTAVAAQGIIPPTNNVFTLEGYTGAVAVIGTAAQTVAVVEI